MAAHGLRAALYEPLDWALLRAPLLAASEARHVEPPAEADSLMPADPRIQFAIEIASPNLAAALRTTRPCDDIADRKRRKLRCYLIRMSTRATPFGLFAGVGMVEWTCSASDVALTAGPLVTRTRPDMAWLMDFVAALEADPGIRQRLPLVASSSIALRGDRVFAAGASIEGDISVRASPVVRQVLAAARSPTTFGELVAIASGAPGATPHRATRLVDQLWGQGFLRSVLRPPLTSGDPASYVRARLGSIPDASAWADKVDALLAELARCDGSDGDGRLDALAAVRRRMDALHPIAQNANVIQTDLRLPLVGNRLRREVGRETAEAARLLSELNPASAQLDGYRDAFVAKYGYDRHVPLLDMLDPDIGLGPPTSYQAGRTSRISPARDQLLLDLALQANRDRQFVVELTDRHIADLTVSPLPGIDYALSIELCIAVAATSAKAVDAGEFQIVVGPNVGAPAAGRHLGRFADLLGRGAVDALAAAAQAEQQRSPATLAEVVYTPARAHTANVVIRPAVRTHEIVVDTAPGVPGERVVPLNELLVSVRSGQFVFSWPRGGTEIVAVQGHMLNPRAAPPAVRFLFDANAQRRATLAAFSWGPATNFAFLPRVQRGRIVLAPARWRVPSGLLVADADTFGTAMSAWRTQWHVPRHVYLGYGDNRLLLDLEAADHVDLLRDELRKAAAGSSVVIHEGLPGPDHAWLAGPTGNHLCELVVPLRRRDQEWQPTARVGRPKLDMHSAVARLRPPGSDWLYLKLYCPAWRRDEIIGEPLHSFADFATCAALSDGWFFIRYADPECHLRIRFHGDAATLLGPLLKQVCEWAGQLVEDGVCSRFSFDTYEREVERFGGRQAMDLAERIFMADSAFVSEALHALAERRLSVDKLTLAMVSSDHLLESLGLPAAARAAFYRAVAPTTPSGGAEYRRRKRDLRELLCQGPPIELARLLAVRSAALARVAELLPAYVQFDRPGSSGNNLYSSHVHMHINRIIEMGHGNEQLVLELLRRTRDGLERTQLRAVAGADTKTRAPNSHGAAPKSPTSTGEK